MMRVGVFIAALAVLGVACGGSGGAGSQEVELSFAAMVGDREFVCGDTYENLGSHDTTLRLVDFRFYVQDVALKNAAGEETGKRQSTVHKPERTDRSREPC